MMFHRFQGSGGRAFVSLQRVGDLSRYVLASTHQHGGRVDGPPDCFFRQFIGQSLEVAWDHIASASAATNAGPDPVNPVM